MGLRGELVLLDDQDRSSWDRSRIDEGRTTLDRAMRMRRVGQYQLQAAIAALHDDAASTDETDWTEIAGLYAILGRVAPSPVVELNRAVAVAMARGPESGLAIVDSLAAGGQLDDYPYLHSTRADLLRRLGRRPRRPRPTVAPWSSPRTSRSGRSWSVGCGRSRRADRESKRRGRKSAAALVVRARDDQPAQIA